VPPTGLLVGILGGMGPAATADFYEKLIKATPARTDQEHLRVVMWADPTVPDRTEALKDAGADLIAVPCNTAHAFVPRIELQVGVRIIHMIEETARHIDAMSPPVDRVALLATTGTVKAGLYQDWLSRTGKKVLLPTAPEQAEVSRIIGEVKAGRVVTELRHRIAEIAETLVARGAQVVVAGCTEIPLVLRPEDVSVPVADPSQILAEAVVAEAGGTLIPQR
jgi:aspartate racemase